MREAKKRERESGLHIIHMEKGDYGSAEFQPPEEAIEAAAAALGRLQVRYAPGPGIEPLRQALAEEMTRRGRPTSAEEIVVTPGAKFAIAASLLLLLDDGDEVILPDPGYPPDEFWARYLRASIKHVRFRDARNIDCDHLESLITPGTRAVICNTPQRPNGQLIENIRELAEVLERFPHVTVVSDEIFSQIVYEPNHHLSLSEFPSLRERTVVIDTFSKTYVMTGFRIGWVVAPPELARNYDILLQNICTNVPTFIQEAALAALKTPRHYVQDLKVRLKHKHDLAYKVLSRVKSLEVQPSQAGFYLYAGLPEGVDDRRMVDRLLDEGVAVVPGSAFGPGGGGAPASNLCPGGCDPLGGRGAAGTGRGRHGGMTRSEGGCRMSTETYGLALTDLLSTDEGMPFGPWERVFVSGIAIDSRRVKPGDLFFALKGRCNDGALYIDDALTRGAVALVIPATARPMGGIPGLRCRDPRLLLPAVAARLFGHPARSLRLIGVTGTNGKTTTVWLTDALLRSAGESVGLLTTAEAYTGRQRFRPEYTTPEAHELHRYFREMVNSGLRYACMEVSSHGISLHRVRGVRFQIGVVTNVSSDHQDFHPDFEHYLKAKTAFVEEIPRDGVCLLNAEDERVMAMRKGVKAGVVSYGFGEADICARDIEQGAWGTRFTVTTKGMFPRPGGAGTVSPPALAVETKLTGRHNVLNLLAAIATALICGVEAEDIGRAAPSLEPPPRRLETRRVGDRVIISDVAMNEGSYEAVFETMRAIGYRQLVVVNAVRGNRGSAVNAAIARVLAKWNRKLRFGSLIVTGSRSHVARYSADYGVRPEEMAAFVENAVREGLEVCVHEELYPAIEEGVGRLGPGGVLLLLGTFGMDDGAAIAAGILEGR